MMEIGAVEKIIMQSILKSVMDFNNSLEMLEPGVKKYFKDNFDNVWCTLRGWELIGDGNNIQIEYTEYQLNGDNVCKGGIVPTVDIVKIAVELSLKKI